MILGQGQGVSRGQYQSRLKGNREITGRPGWLKKKKKTTDEIDNDGDDGKKRGQVMMVVMVKRGAR